MSSAYNRRAIIIEVASFLPTFLYNNKRAVMCLAKGHVTVLEVIVIAIEDAVHGIILLSISFFVAQGGLVKANFLLPLAVFVFRVYHNHI